MATVIPTAFPRQDARTLADDGDEFHFCSTCAFSDACLSQGMDKSSLQDLHVLVEHVGPLSPGDHVFREGDRFEAIAAVRAGTVKTYVIDRDGREHVPGMRGFSLVELIASMTIFLVFLTIMFSLTTEMRGHEKRLPVNLMQHPQTNALLARMRKDVLSATRYRPAFQEYEASSTVLILYSLQESGFGHDIVWDFRTPHVAVRRAYSAGALVSEWKARGLPKLAITPVALDGDPPTVSDDLDFENAQGSGRMSSVRIVGKDEANRLAIDQIFQPRAHR